MSFQNNNSNKSFARHRDQHMPRPELQPSQQSSFYQCYPQFPASQSFSNYSNCNQFDSLKHYNTNRNQLLQVQNKPAFNHQYLKCSTVNSEQYPNRQFHTQQVKNQYRTKPFDPRRKYEKPDRKPSNEQSKTLRRQKQTVYQQPKQDNSQLSESDKESESEDQEQLYVKTKLISKKKDPVMDTPQEIKKWIEARKRNYPTFGRQPEKQKISSEMSILQQKIRKKIMLVSADSRGLMKKLKNMHILKRLITDPNLQSNQQRKQRTKAANEKTRQILTKSHAYEKGQQTSLREKVRMIKKESETVFQSQPNSEKQQNSQCAVQKPVQKMNPLGNQTQDPERIEDENGSCPKSKVGKGLTPEQMIKHLKQKQEEDRDFYGKLFDYKTNSLSYRYSARTLQTNFILQDVFEESSYMLQIIRHVVKNNFFERP